MVGQDQGPHRYGHSQWSRGRRRPDRYALRAIQPAANADEHQDEPPGHRPEATAAQADESTDNRQPEKGKPLGCSATSTMTPERADPGAQAPACARLRAPGAPKRQLDRPWTPGELTEATKGPQPGSRALAGP